MVRDPSTLFLWHIRWKSSIYVPEKHLQLSIKWKCHVLRSRTKVHCMKYVAVPYAQTAIFGSNCYVLRKCYSLACCCGMIGRAQNFMSLATRRSGLYFKCVWVMLHVRWLFAGVHSFTDFCQSVISSIHLGINCLHVHNHVSLPLGISFFFLPVLLIKDKLSQSCGVECFDIKHYCYSHLYLCLDLPYYLFFSLLMNICTHLLDSYLFLHSYYMNCMCLPRVMLMYGSLM